MSLSRPSATSLSTRRRCRRASFCATALFWMAGSATAQGLLPARDLTARVANDAAIAGLEECTRLGYRVAVVVSDRGGHVRASVRGDGAGPHVYDAARQKAYTAASSANSTLVWSENLIRGLRAPDPNLVHLDGVLIIGGGLPIKVGDQVVGAIGVAGAPGGDIDDSCAQAGIASIQNQLR